MKGLEATEISFSGLDETLRIDADYYRPTHLLVEQSITKGRHASLQNLGRFIPGPFGSEFHVANFDEQSEVRYVRGKDVKPFFLENGDNVYIPAGDFTRMNDFALRCDDVLISVVGTLGNASLVTEDVLPAIYSCKSTVFRASGVDARYLTAYLNSSYGRSLLLRNTRGTVQTGLNLPDLRKILLPRFSQEFEANIAEHVSNSYETRNNSKTLYQAAEATLLQSLGLEGWEPPQPLAYQSTFSQAWGANRLDAEHFQPKYAALMAHLRQQAPRIRPVRDFMQLCDRGAQPIYNAQGTLAVVNSRHILETGLDYDNFERADASYWTHPDYFTARIQRGDVLTYMTGANVGRTAVYLSDEKALASNEVNILRLSEENPVYVAVALNSLIGRMQTRRDVTGSAQVHLYPSDIMNFVVPFVDEGVQQEIAQAVEEAHRARRRAKTLLETAKRAVEAAIERDEAAGLALLAAADGND